MKLTSTALPSSEGFRANRTAHLALLETAREAAEAAIAGGGPKALERHVSRGKMPPRERVANLLDPGSPFLEIGATGGAWPVRRRRALCGGHRRGRAGAWART